jgi:hypothetical protein
MNPDSQTWPKSVQAHYQLAQTLQPQRSAIHGRPQIRKQHRTL